VLRQAPIPIAPLPRVDRYVVHADFTSKTDAEFRSLVLRALLKNRKSGKPRNVTSVPGRRSA